MWFSPRATSVFRSLMIGTIAAAVSDGQRDALTVTFQFGRLAVRPGRTGMLQYRTPGRIEHLYRAGALLNLIGGDHRNAQCSDYRQWLRRPHRRDLRCARQSEALGD